MLGLETEHPQVQKLRRVSMSFMQEVLASSRAIWDDCAATPFVQAIKSGTLPMEKFKAYMIQDSIYLKHYARTFGKAIYCSATLKEVQLYYSALGFVTDTESAVRLNYLKKFGLTDDDIEHIAPFEENQNYIDYLIGAAQGDDICQILMAILPCLLSYCYIFKRIAAEPAAKESPYWDFISDYAAEHFDAICEQWIAYGDEKCNGLPLEKRQELNRIFERGSLLELDFWKMAYRTTCKEGLN